jgi:hypothetical protein
MTFHISTFANNQRKHVFLGMLQLCVPAEIDNIRLEKLSMSFSLEVLEALSDKNCWGEGEEEREREVDQWCFLLEAMNSLPSTSFFGIASSI